MDKEGLKNLREKFEQGIKAAEEMIENIKTYRPEGELAFDETIQLQLRAIENYSGSIAFIDRYLTDPVARQTR